jgi:hypothetical protein
MNRRERASGPATPAAHMAAVDDANDFFAKAGLGPPQPQMPDRGLQRVTPRCDFQRC